MSFWRTVTDHGRIYAEHYIYGRVLYDVDITALAGMRNPEYDYAHIEEKTWAGQGAADELKSIVEAFKKGELR